MFQAVIIYVLSACLRTCDLVIFAILAAVFKRVLPAVQVTRRFKSQHNNAMPEFLSLQL